MTHKYLLIIFGQVLYMLFVSAQSPPNDEGLFSNTSSYSDLSENIYHDSHSSEKIDLLEVVLRNTSDGNLEMSIPSIDHGLSNHPHLTKIMINITYNLLYTEVFSDIKAAFCSAGVISSFANLEHEGYYIDQCRNSVFNFKEPTDYQYVVKSKFKRYCQKHTDIRKLNQYGTYDKIITDLLPGQPYSFRVSLQSDLFGNNRTYQESVLIESANICTYTLQLKPEYVPQTGEGSFAWLDRKNNTGDVSRIELYWRPVPEVLRSGKILSYHLRCVDNFNQQLLSMIIDDPLVGQISLHKANNISYSCELKSINSLGRSNKSSPIFVPSKSHLIDIEHINFYITELTSQEYILKWPDPDRSELEKIMSSVPDEYSYTVYWCKRSPARDDCSNFEGMYSSRTSWKSRIKNLTLPAQKIEDRKFALSFRINNLYSGMIWMKCLSRLGSIDKSFTNQLKLIEAKGVEGNHTSLKIGWRFISCPLIPVVKTYEISMCIIEQVNPCSAQVDNVIAKEEVQRLIASTDLMDCSTSQVHDPLKTDALVNNLNSSTKYLVRVRFHLNDGQNLSEWSQGVLAQTYADPVDTRECWRQSLVFNIVAIMGSLLFCGLLYLMSHRFIRRRFSVLIGYTRSHIELPDRLTDNDIFDDPRQLIKAAANSFNLGKDPESESNLSGSQALDVTSVHSAEVNDCSQNSLKYKFPIFDYIPCELLSGDEMAEQTTTESQQGSPHEDLHNALTNADEVSLTSHSSFLATILEQTDEPINNLK